MTLLHFSDYHSHAQNLARAVGYLERHKRDGAIVFNGGDMMNRGAPAWSDKYRCVEWEWLNGIVDAMALGNHDADYGADVFARCIDRVSYPILSANTEGFLPFTIIQRGELRLGVFAVAGSDFNTLVKVPELKFSDPVTAARSVVKHLREVEHVNAVVMIGHEHKDDDYALASAVPGIDVIFGTHSHIKQVLTQIPGTDTWFISPYQYLTYISRVDVTFKDGRLDLVRGNLVEMDASIAPSASIEKRVAQLQTALEVDPQYSELFKPIGTLAAGISVEKLGALAVQAMREAAGADVAISTASSFRESLHAGVLNLEALRAAMPYDNDLVVAELPASTYAQLLKLAQSEYVAGVPATDKTTITVATTDYMTRVAPGYRELFAGVPVRSTGKKVREVVRQRLVP